MLGTREGVFALDQSRISLEETPRFPHMTVLENMHINGTKPTDICIQRNTSDMSKLFSIRLHKHNTATNSSNTLAGSGNTSVLCWCSARFVVGNSSHVSPAHSADTYQALSCCSATIFPP